jgi:CheY-like chemotaxis protein
MGCGGCILVVDDDADICAALRECIEAMGCSVAIAADGFAGLAQLEREPLPCFVLLDLNMPGLDGPGFAGRVRAAPRHSDLPIVSMSAGTQELRPPVVHAHLRKPFQMTELEPAIERFCRLPQP